ncbi:hypothetical protein KK060_21575 [Fulvivirgaceae bacterium PWU20]|uniref:Uncharacterized protein n=1 Tax=Chryseosolibacter indicus TaxID=2782351 RepID=A0ABS5VXC2_9BACT|nr:hypothetical protein [Chryseosolibacter indicus]
MYIYFMIVNEDALKHWMINFYGYGSWKAPIWFVGLEEQGGDLPEDVAERINYFQGTSSIKELADIRELYSRIKFRAEGPRGARYNNNYDYRFGERGVLHGAWKNLIAFAHAFNSELQPDLFEYQQRTFLSPSLQREALLNLYPLPTPHNHAWYYAWLNMPGLPFLKTRDAYRQHFYESRITRLLRNLTTYTPSVVLMYGMDNVNALKQSVLQFFPNVKFTMEKGIARVIPAHHRTKVEGTTLIITTHVPALRHNRIETGFDWEQFGKRIRGTV